MKETVVRIVIEGGIANVTRKDKGVKLIIVDKDGLKVGEGIRKEEYEAETQIYSYQRN